MRLPDDFVRDVKALFPDAAYLDLILFQGMIHGVHSFLASAYKDVEISPLQILEMTESPDLIRQLRERAEKANKIKALLDQATVLKREEDRRRRHEEEAND